MEYIGYFPPVLAEIYPTACDGRMRYSEFALYRQDRPSPKDCLKIIMNILLHFLVFKRWFCYQVYLFSQ